MQTVAASELLLGMHGSSRLAAGMGSMGAACCPRMGTYRLAGCRCSRGWHDCKLLLACMGKGLKVVGLTGEKGVPGAAWEKQQV